MADDDTSLGDGVVGEFATYEDYLDSQISTTDIYYLEDEDLARQLVVGATITAALACLCPASLSACARRPWRA